MDSDLQPVPEIDHATLGHEEKGTVTIKKEWFSHKINDEDKQDDSSMDSDLDSG